MPQRHNSCSYSPAGNNIFDCGNRYNEQGKHFPAIVNTAGVKA